MQIDPSTLSRRDSYHFMISAIVPRPIAFVSTVDGKGRTNVAPFSYFTGVSAAPPSLLICAGSRRGRVKDTCRNILETEEFVVNVVVEDLMDAVVIGGTDHAPGVSEIELAGLETAPGVKVRAPLLTGSPVNLECRLMKTVEVAGSSVLIGEVVWIHVRDDLVSGDADRRVIDVSRLSPIARLDGDDYSRLGEVFSRSRK